MTFSEWSHIENHPHPMKTKKTLIPFLAAALLASSSAHAAFTIIATDTVDAVGNYTFSGETSSPSTFTTGGVGNGAYARFSRNTGSALPTNVRFTAGFGESITVAEGTYRLSAHSGNVVNGRIPWNTFDVKLMTNAGVAWESLASNAISKTVLTPYVTPAFGGWSQTEVEYVIPEGHALIGTEFTWGFTGGKPDGAYGTAWDFAEVQFEAIPEPATALLGGLGMLMLLRRRRS